MNWISMKVKDITNKINFTDQIYGLGHHLAPVISFPKGNRKNTSYTNTALKKINWQSDYIAQYIPYNTPQANAGDVAGKIGALVSIYPKEGVTQDYVSEEAWKLFKLEQWPHAIMLREVFYFYEPPILKDVYSDTKQLTTDARGRLGYPGPELYEALKELEIYPIHNLYRTPKALEYLNIIENNSSMQIVANRRTGKAGYVYALSLPQFPGWIKIGSAFDVSCRICGLSTGIPVDFECAGSYFSEDCRKLERKVHEILSQHRIRKDREWFNCSIESFFDAIEMPASAGSCTL